MMTPKWRQWLLEQQNDAARVRFVYADATACGAAVKEIAAYSSCQPVFLFLHGGSVVERVEGINPPRLIRCLEAWACMPLPSTRGGSGDSGAVDEAITEAGMPKTEH